jgi:glutathione S-transferase
MLSRSSAIDVESLRVPLPLARPIALAWSGVTWRWRRNVDSLKYRRALFEAYPWPIRTAGKLIAPGIEEVMRAKEGIHPEGLERARVAILEAADRLERETGGDASRYLVGSAITLADITAASLFAPLVAPPESPYARIPSELPPEVHDMRRALRDRPAGKWVMERYRRDRRGP